MSGYLLLTRPRSVSGQYIDGSEKNLLLLSENDTQLTWTTYTVFTHTRYLRIHGIYAYTVFTHTRYLRIHGIYACTVFTHTRYLRIHGIYAYTVFTHTRYLPMHTNGGLLVEANDYIRSHVIICIYYTSLVEVFKYYINTKGFA